MDQRANMRHRGDTWRNMFDQRDVFGIHTSRTRPKHAKPHLPSCPRPRFTKHVSTPLFQLRYSTLKSHGREAFCTHQQTTWPQTRSRYREGMRDGSCERDDTPFAFPLSQQHSIPLHRRTSSCTYYEYHSSYFIFEEYLHCSQTSYNSSRASQWKLVDSNAISMARSIPSDD